MWIKARKGRQSQLFVLRSYHVSPARWGPSFLYHTAGLCVAKITRAVDYCCSLALTFSLASTRPVMGSEAMYTYASSTLSSRERHWCLNFGPAGSPPWPGVSTLAQSSTLGQSPPQLITKQTTPLGFISTSGQTACVYTTVLNGISICEADLLILFLMMLQTALWASALSGMPLGWSSRGSRAPGAHTALLGC